MAETETDSAMTPLQSAAFTYRIALGHRAGQKVLTLQSVSSFEAQPTQERCINEQGFSLHAEVRCAMNQRHKLEKLQPHCAITRQWLAALHSYDHTCCASLAWRDGQCAASLW